MAVYPWASFLGLANRAGKLITGEEMTVKEIQRGNAKLILLSEDASRNTEKKITDKASFYNVPVCRVENREILGQAIGKESRVVVAVVDTGFAKKLKTLIDGE